MKKINVCLASALVVFSMSSFALDTKLLKETKNWKSVPITVDTTANTYTVTGAMPNGTTRYYYSYPGHRCFMNKQKMMHVDPVILKAGTSGGKDIYCYSEG